MCVVSMVGDFYRDKWDGKPWVPSILPGVVPMTPGNPPYRPFEEVSKEEFDALKKDVQEMKELLKRAVEYDRRTNQPNCEMEEKVALLKAVAKAVDVDLSDVFGGKNGQA